MSRQQISRWPLVWRVAVVAVWLALFGAVLEREYLVERLDTKERQVLQESRQESWQGVYFQGERIGYVRTRLVPEPDQGDGGLVLDQEAHLTLKVLNETHPVDMRVQARLTDQSRLREFSFTLASPFYRMEAEGRITGNRLRYTLTTGKEKAVVREVVLAEAPFIALPARSYLLRQGLAAGDRFKVPYFDPLSLETRETVLEYRGLEKTLIRGRVHQLHRFTESVAGIRVNSWLDESGKVIKEESPAGFVFLAEPKFRATDISSRGPELLSSVSVPLLGSPPENWLSRSAVRYRLTLPAESFFPALAGDRQDFMDGVLTVRRDEVPAGSANSVCVGTEKDLAPTIYVQATNPAISAQAGKVIVDATDPLAKVRALAEWVFVKLEKRPVLGIPDALTTLNAGVGDCNEHAVLFAALARSVGIPARIASGVVFHQGAFYYHAWNEVCLGDRWISLDTTRNELPADPSHIRFVIGETAEQMRISALIGALGIEIVE